MKRVALYSQSRPAATAAEPPQRPLERAPAEAPQPPKADPSAAPASRPAAWRRFAARYDRPLLVLAGALLMGLALLALQRSGPASRTLTQADIDKAVLHTLNTKVLPSPAAKAAEKVRPAVVRVRGVAPGERGDADIDEGVGSGVVIVDTGVILTNLHVVSGSEKVVVEFFNGHESDAAVIGTKPEHDLAVLQAKSLPDDLFPATLRSTSDLQPGDQVVAVGFPFGIGPSVSAGVISGLGREFRSHDDKRVLTNLIQFDAAANPGNSGGPLITMDGEVVGIVTAILNPGRERTFIGIGFAVPIENAATGAGIHPF
jgi:S1-C subfamily serine protease